MSWRQPATTRRYADSSRQNAGAFLLAAFGRLPTADCSLDFHIRNVFRSQLLHKIYDFVMAVPRIVGFDHQEEVIACG
jgi:hypothetical protein